MITVRTTAADAAASFRPLGLTRGLSLVSADVWILALAVAITLGLGLLALPRGEFPIHDETYYAGPAVRLAQTGALLLDEEIWASSVTLITWGALALKLFGGGLVVLRCAMLALGVLCVLAFDALLRQLDFDRGPRALALTALAVQPLFVSRSVSFMTEMPFELFVLTALATGLAGLRQRQLGLLAAAGGCAAAAFLTRQIGVLVVVALAVGVLGSPGLRKRWRPWLALLLPSIVVIAAFCWWRYGSSDPSLAAEPFVAAADQWQQPRELLWELVLRLAHAMAYLGAFALPLLAAHSSRLPTYLRQLDGRGRLALAMGLVIGLASFGVAGQQPLPYLGNAAHPLRGLVREMPLAVEAAIGHSVITGVACLFWGAGGLVLGLAFARWWQNGARWWGHAHLPCYATGVLLLLAPLGAPVFYERYHFPLLPFAFVLCLVALRPLPIGRLPAAAVLTLCASLSIAFMIDKGQRAAVTWQAAEALVAEGVPPQTIEAGFEWTYWWQFWDAYHSDPNRPVMIARKALTMATYRVAFAPMPGYEVERTLPFSTPLTWGTQYVYLLRPSSRPVN